MIEKRFTEEEFINRRNSFLNELVDLDYKYSHWISKNHGFYKDGSIPSLSEVVYVYYDQDHLTLRIGLKNAPTQLVLDVNDIFNKHFKKE